MSELWGVCDSETGDHRQGGCGPFGVVLHGLQSVVAGAGPRRIEAAERFLARSLATKGTEP